MRERTRFDRLAWAAVYACSVIAVAAVVTLGVLRLFYPYELEWMEGAMMDHSARILAGKPIYTAPTVDFVAWLYPPLYYYAVAAIMKLTSTTWLAGRLVSFASSLATASMLGVITARITARRSLGLVTFALYLASYHATGYYFDIVRNDAFFTAILVACGFAVIRLRGSAAAILSAILLILAFFTKQQAAFFFPALLIWFWLGSKRNALTFALCCIVLGAASYLLLERATDGWLSYYLFAIPDAKRSSFSWLRAFTAIPDSALHYFALSTLAAAALAAYSYKHRVAFWHSERGLLLMMSLAAFVGAALSVGNDGGYRNVMMPFAAFAIPLLPIALAEFSLHIPELWKFTPIVLLLQFLAFSFDPLSEKMLIPSAKQRLGGDAFMAKLRTISGEVFTPYHGFITTQAGKPSHAHILSTIDVMRMNDTTAHRLAADFEKAYATHRFSAVILDESKAFRVDSVAGYHQAGEMLAEPNVYLTRVADESTRPQYIFVPKVDTARSIQAKP